MKKCLDAWLPAVAQATGMLLLVVATGWWWRPEAAVMLTGLFLIAWGFLATGDGQ